MDPSFQPFDHFVPPAFSGKAKSWSSPVSVSVFVAAGQSALPSNKSPTTRVKRNPASSPRQGWKSPKQLEEDASPVPSPRVKSPRASEANVEVLEPAPLPPRAKQAPLQQQQQLPPVPRRPAPPPVPTQQDSVYEDAPMPDPDAEAERREELHRLSLLLSAKEHEEMLARQEEEEARAVAEEQERLRREQEEEEEARRREEERRKQEQQAAVKRAAPVGKAPPSPSFRPANTPIPVKAAEKICGVCDSASPADQTFCVECGSKLT